MPAPLRRSDCERRAPCPATRPQAVWIAGLMIAATVIGEKLPLFTTSPGDYAGLEKLIRIIPVARPPLPHEKAPG